MSVVRVSNQINQMKKATCSCIRSSLFSVDHNELFSKGKSPGVPEYYDNNLDLTWLIQVQLGQSIEINFLYFDVEYNPYCDTQSSTDIW